MAPAAFVTSFLGSSLPHTRHASNTNTPRCKMGDSEAPVITIKDTKSDQTSKVTVTYQPIAPNVAQAISITSNAALEATLRSKTNTSSDSPSKSPCPPGVSPADHYFPASIRDTAPVISLVYNDSISVSYDPINPSVAGVGASKEVAFWKKPVYKYSTPEQASDSAPEVLSTAAYEKYFPTKIRNRAPFINMRGPNGEWDKTAFLEVGSEFVELNLEVARNVSVPQSFEDPSASGSAAVAKFFDDHLHIAPEIDIKTGDVPSVSFGMQKVEEPTALAAKIFSDASDS